MVPRVNREASVYKDQGVRLVLLVLRAHQEAEDLEDQLVSPDLLEPREDQDVLVPLEIEECLELGERVADQALPGQLAQLDLLDLEVWLGSQGPQDLQVQQVPQVPLVLLVLEDQPDPLVPLAQALPLCKQNF
jgi:hypothetical protein